MGPERLERERRQGPACRELVRGLLEGLLEQGALPARDRVRVGMILDRLGDSKPLWQGRVEGRLRLSVQPNRFFPFSLPASVASRRKSCLHLPSEVVD